MQLTLYFEYQLESPPFSFCSTGQYLFSSYTTGRVLVRSVNK